VENAAVKAADVFTDYQLAISLTGELRHAGQLFRVTVEASGDLHGSAVISKMIWLVADELANPNISLKWAAKDMLFMNPD
ncbi:DNA-binding response regulator, partial [Bacillus vallismortis]|nr:DNA-binding response regulator [Bacillus vallismortis]